MQRKENDTVPWEALVLLVTMIDTQFISYTNCGLQIRPSIIWAMVNLSTCIEFRFSKSSLGSTVLRAAIRLQPVQCCFNQGMEVSQNKGVLTTVHPYCAQARLTPKVQVIRLVWSLHTRHSTLDEVGQSTVNHTQAHYTSSVIANRAQIRKTDMMCMCMMWLTRACGHARYTCTVPQRIGFGRLYILFHFFLQIILVPVKVTAVSSAFFHLSTQ